MIDIEPIVYNTVHDAVKAQFPSAVISNLPPEMDAKFPFVVIREESNRTYQRTQDNSEMEHHATVVYEISVYSNKQVGRQQECKAILALIDETMQEMLFTRVQKHELPTVDRTIMRMYARYEAVVEEPEDVDGTTVYQMYRR